jgi:hypothetical protein
MFFGRKAQITNMCLNLWTQKFIPTLASPTTVWLSKKSMLASRPNIARHKASEEIFHPEKIQAHHLGKGTDS